MHPIHDPQTDRDHDRVITLFEALCHLADWTAEGRAANAELLAELINYASAHCQREETLMGNAGYPGLAAHAAAHRAMARHLRRLEGPMLAGRLSVQEELAVVRELFLSHIVTFDEQFGEWLAVRASNQHNPAAS